MPEQDLYQPIHAPRHTGAGLSAQSPQSPQSPQESQVPTFLIVAACVVAPGLLSYYLASGNEAQVLAAVIAIVGLCAVIARPFVGLLLFIALLYFRPEETFPALAGMRLTLTVSLVVVAGLWLRLTLDREPFVKTPLISMMMGFGIAAVASSIGTGSISTALMDIAKLVMLVVLVTNLVRTPQQYRTLITTIVLFTAYLSAYSIYLYYSGDAMWREGAAVFQSKATGIFSDPNDLSATIVAGLALTLARAVSARKYGRLGYISLSAIMLWATLLTNSRGGMLALMVMVGGFFISFQRRKLLGLILGGIAITALLVLGSGRMTNFDSQEESANSRFHYWDEGLTQLMMHPVLGCGYARFPDVNAGMTAHNTFVLCFAETGFVGFFFWMGSLYHAFRRRPTDQTANLELQQKHDLLGARLALTSLLMACFWISRTYVPTTYLFICLPVAQQISASKELQSLRSRQTAEDLWRIVGACMAMIVLVFILVHKYR
jgi:putative inorganic carbon (HCO3(-)) transporter